MDQAGGRAIISIAEKIGWAAETLRSRMRQAERDGGRSHGLTTDERDPHRQGGAGTAGRGAVAAACSNRSATFRRPSSRQPTMTVRPLRSAWRFSHNELS